MRWGKIILLAVILILMLSAIFVTSGDGSGLVTQNKQLRAQLKRERFIYRAQIRELRKIAEPILQPTPQGNKALARMFFGSSYSCAYEIIEGETGGTWRHDIGYGGVYGEYLIYSGRPYGLGQALPGTKMLKYGADAATNPLTQMIWFRAYAIERYGSVCNAAYHWSTHKSW